MSAWDWNNLTPEQRRAILEREIRSVNERWLALLKREHQAVTQ